LPSAMREGYGCPTLPRATTVVLALAFGLTSGSSVLAAQATGKPPDNPFDERAGGGESGRADETEDQGKKPSDTAKTGDEPITSEPEEGGEEPSAGEEEEPEGNL